MKEQKTLIIAVIVIIVLGGIGTAAYFGLKKNPSNTDTAKNTTDQTQIKPKTIDLAQVMNEAKAKFPTVTQTKVYDEQTDPNNMIGKPGQYVAGAAFLDSRTNTDTSVSTSWGADGGGGIEVFATTADAQKRADYFTSLQSSGSPLTDPGAFKQTDKYVVRASSSLTKSQQDEIITYLSSLVQ